MSAECPLYTEAHWSVFADPNPVAVIFGKTVCNGCPVGGKRVSGEGRTPDEASIDLTKQVQQVRRLNGCVALTQPSARPPRAQDSR